MSRSCPDVAPGKSTPVLQRNSSFDDGGGFYLRRRDRKCARKTNKDGRPFCSRLFMGNSKLWHCAAVRTSSLRPGFVSSCVRGGVSRTLKGYSSEKAAHDVLHMATTSPFFNKNWLLKTTRKGGADGHACALKSQYH